MRNRRATSRAGFTIVEIIVVVVILAIVATFVAPRLSGMAGRRAEAAANAVAAVVSSAATRDQLGSRKLALDFDGGRLRVLSLVQTDRGSAWREDAMSLAVDLGSLRVLSVTLDGSPLDPTSWRWELPQGERRAVFAMVLGESMGPGAWRVELGSLASDAQAVPATAPSMPEDSVDLDATGRGDTAW